MRAACTIVSHASCTGFYGEETQMTENPRPIMESRRDQMFLERLEIDRLRHFGEVAALHVFLNPSGACVPPPAVRVHG